MRKYVKPRAKFHELKGTVILVGSDGVSAATVGGRSVKAGSWSEGSSYSDANFIDE